MSDGNTKTALIVGASRGLGLGLANELAGRGWKVTATVRSGKGDGLSGAQVETLDINDAAAVEAFAGRMQSGMFDVVFINAGVGGPTGTAATVAPDEAAAVFLTNAVAPVRLAMKLVPAVRPGTGIVAFMSSVLGSIACNTHGQWPLYSASKAALNQLSRGFAAGPAKEARLTVLSVHPGWVKTDMGGPNADIDVATSVRGIAEVLESKAGAGGHAFVDYQGKTLPW